MSIYHTNISYKLIIRLYEYIYMSKIRIYDTICMFMYSIYYRYLVINSRYKTPPHTRTRFAVDATALSTIEMLCINVTIF